ncbi:MAG: hypothetical protein LYZ69_02265 [Nitrososphaerales archaeon]|nr:hypothetical protein [Nitrososphaerales archaeon]
MSQSVLGIISPGSPCHCGSHSLHRVFVYRWSHSSARCRDAARALHTSEGNVKVAMHRLRKANLDSTCPQCFRPRLPRGVWQNCDF